MFKFWKKEPVDDSLENSESHENSTESDSLENLENSVEQNSLENDKEVVKKVDVEDISSDNIKNEESTFSDRNDYENDSIEDDYSITDDINEGVEKPQSEKQGVFARLLQGLAKTKNNIIGRIDGILKSYTKIDEDLLEELEEVLITADIGMNTTLEIIDKLRDMIKERGVKDPIEVKNLLKEIIRDILSEGDNTLKIEPSPAIIVMVGVNGVGKTTTIGKLAQKYKNENKKVLLAAADTFRAAASEQLEVWSKRVGVEIVKHQEGADPGAVIFDSIQASKARGVDLLICDTAGRLHNKTNLMNELGKIFKIIDREYPEAKKEVLLVVDATTGQNAVVQAKTFKEAADITGIVLTKLDGTAKGGVVLAVKSEVDVPVKFIGVGERTEDLQIFDPESFTNAIFGE